MLERIYLLFEIVSAILVLWMLHGSKKRPGIVTIVYLCLELIIMAMIDEGWISRQFDYFAYIGIILVDIFEFDDKLKHAVIYTIADVMIMFVSQIFCIVVYALCFHTENVNEFEAIVVSLVMLVILLLVFIKCDLHTFFSSLLEKSYFSETIIIIFFIILFVLLKQESYKLIVDGNLIMFLILFFLITFLIALKLGKEILQKNLYVEQLEQYEQYNEVYKDLISEIRHRQHDFDNHLQALYSMSMSCSTIEELQNEQGKYFEQLIDENRSYKLLRENVSSILTAFLHLKFEEVEEKGITVCYHIHVNKIEKMIPFSDIVELVGNLLDNAVEATMKNANKTIQFEIEEKENEVSFILTNPYEWIEGESFNNYLIDGNSTKGKNRGFGLTNVNKIVKKYHGFIQIYFDYDQEVKIVRFEIVLQVKQERQ